MNVVGIDVSKGKSTVAVLRPFGEVVASPFDVIHNDSDLKQFAEMIKGLPGESKVVMEYTDTYFEPIAQFLHNNGIFVSVVNALLIHDYGGNSLRKVKTDKKDALKLASYALDRWTELEEYVPADEQRRTLKLLNRQYNQSNKIQTMIKNNLLSCSFFILGLDFYLQVSINRIHVNRNPHVRVKIQRILVLADVSGSDILYYICHIVTQPDKMLLVLAVFIFHDDF